MLDHRLVLYSSENGVHTSCISVEHKKCDHHALREVNAALKLQVSRTAMFVRIKNHKSAFGYSFTMFILSLK